LTWYTRVLAVMRVKIADQSFYCDGDGHELLTKTRVSSGRLASVVFKALFISAPVPWKNLPHPDAVSMVRCARKVLHPIASHTAVEQSVACKDNSVVFVLHIPTDAVLRMARRIQRLDNDGADIKCLPVLRRSRYCRAVLPADDLKFGRVQCGALMVRLRQREKQNRTGHGSPSLCCRPHGRRDCVCPVSGYPQEVKYQRPTDVC
jgi:hypothetical protein